MDQINGQEDDSAKAITNTLKDMLNINGSPEEEAEIPEQGVSPTKENGDEKEEAEKKSPTPDEDAQNMEGATVQKIDLAKAADGECIPIFGEEVTVLTSPLSNIESNASGSDKVRIRPITKFEWQHKYYTGNLVSVTSDYAAYAIKSRSFAIRVINLKNTSDRLLLRGFTAPVCDVSFAHTTSPLISGIDEDGTFIIWQLSQNGENTSVSKKLHVEASKDVHLTSLYHRLVWLTHMHCDIDGCDVGDIIATEEGEAESDSANHKKLLTVTHGNIVEVWNINTAFEVPSDEEESLSKEKLQHAFMTISGHDDVISDCELSPEGSVLAVASHDGYVKFWQINVEKTEEATCLHRWKPHGDRPVSLVTFCDNRKQPHLVLYWRFMLTGCEQNSELKIWCTVTWSCLQKFSFKSPPGNPLPFPALKCALHVAADYLVLSDVNRKVVYVLRCVTDLQDGRASLTSISQYLLTTPLLSFAIKDCIKCKFKNSLVDEERDQQNEDDEALDDDKDDEDGEDDAEANDASRRMRGVLIKLVSIHTKSLESLDIRYIPKPSDDSSLSLSTFNTLQDDINVVSVDESLSVVSQSIENGHSQDEQEEARNDEEEEEDHTGNETALTAQEGDQSTILAGNEEENEDRGDDSGVLQMQTNEEKLDPPEDDKPSSTSNLDLVVDVTGDPPVAQSSPATRRQYSLPENSDREQGEGETRESPLKSETHPILLTPDAFTSSLKKPEGTASAETSFTHVTSFSVDHPSLFGSERDKSIQEPLKSPTLLKTSPPPPPVLSSTAPTFKSGPELRSSTSPLVPSVAPSLDFASSQSSYHSLLHSLAPNEPGPYGDVQNASYMTKDQSPDLISSASTIEGSTGSTEGRILVGGPLAGAVGGSGDALFLMGQPAPVPFVPANDDADSQSSGGSKRSGQLVGSSAPFPKPPDITMSRMEMERMATRSSSREEVPRSSDLPKRQPVSRPDSVLHADVNSEETSRPSFDRDMGNDILAAILGLRKQHEDGVKTHQKEINKKMNQITKNVDSAMKRFEQQQSEKLERALKSMSESQRKFLTECKTYNATSTEQTSGKIERAVKHEVKNTVLPGLSRTLDPLKDQLHNTLAHKLTATDAVLKEAIGKLVKSKDTIEAIGSATGQAVQSQIHGAYRDTFMTNVVPAFEKSCNAMFQQLSVTFQRGIDEAVVKLEKQLQSHIRVELESMQTTEKQARDTLSELKDTAGQAHTSIASAIEQKIPSMIKSEMRGAQEHLMSELTKSLQAQHQAALKEQKAALSKCLQEWSGPQGQPRAKSQDDVSQHSGTPRRQQKPARPTFEQQQQSILSLLHQGNLNAAFQRALTAADLNLVMYVCEMVDPTVVFGTTPCALHQPILLSLIQQLSCDLGYNTSTKLKYLQEAVMNLDKSHQVTQEHMHNVLEVLVKNLNAHVNTLSGLPTDASNNSVIKQMKMLAMAAQSLIQ